MQNLLKNSHLRTILKHLQSPGSWQTRIMLMLCILAWYACIRMLHSHGLNPLRGPGLMIFGPTTILLTHISIIALRWDPWLHTLWNSIGTRTHRIIVAGGFIVALLFVLAIALLNANNLLLLGACAASGLAAGAYIHAHRHTIAQTAANIPTWRKSAIWLVMGLIIAWWGSVPAVLLMVLLSTQYPLSH